MGMLFILAQVLAVLGGWFLAIRSRNGWQALLVGAVVTFLLGAGLSVCAAQLTHTLDPPFVLQTGPFTPSLGPDILALYLSMFCTPFVALAVGACAALRVRRRG
jgi:hypothetical protein